MRLCPAEAAEVNWQASIHTCPGHWRESLAGTKMEHADRAPRRAGCWALPCWRWGEEAPARPVTCQPSLRIGVNRKEIKREAGKPLPAGAGKRGDAASLGPSPRKSKAGSGGTRWGGWPGGGGRQRAHAVPARESHPGTGRPATKPSGAVEAGRGDAPSWAKWGGGGGGASKGEARWTRPRGNGALLRAEELHPNHHSLGRGPMKRPSAQGDPPWYLTPSAAPGPFYPHGPTTGRAPLPSRCGRGPLLSCAPPPGSSCEGAAGLARGLPRGGGGGRPPGLTLPGRPRSARNPRGPPNDAAGRVAGKPRLPRRPRRAPTCCQGNPGVSSAAAFPGGRQPDPPPLPPPLPQPRRDPGGGSWGGEAAERRATRGSAGVAVVRAAPGVGGGGGVWKFNKQLFLRGVFWGVGVSLGRFLPVLGHD